MFVTLRETAGVVILLATVATACGILYRMVVRPLAQLLQEFRDYRAYLHRQLTEGNGADTVRAQLDRIEQAVTPPKEPPT